MNGVGGPNNHHAMLQQQSQSSYAATGMVYHQDEDLSDSSYQSPPGVAIRNPIAANHQRKLSQGSTGSGGPQPPQLQPQPNVIYTSANQSPQRAAPPRPPAGAPPPPPPPPGPMKQEQMSEELDAMGRPSNFALALQSAKLKKISKVRRKNDKVADT